MPKVSIIIPTYNREEFIKGTIDSVLNQTYKDFEIIVVDDGSTDNTKSYLEKYNSKIKLIEQKNSERAVARNNGVKHSSGEYIAFVDSDDIWKEDKLKIQVEVLDNYKDVILTYGTCLRINKNGKTIKPAKRQREGYSGNVFDKLLLRNFVVSATPVLRHAIFNQTKGFKTKYVPYEDWEFWIRLSKLGKFYFIKDPLAFYRLHETQSVQLVKAEKIEEVTTALLLDSFNLQPISNALKNKSLGIANLRFCYWYLLANKPEIAKEKLDYAIKLNPGFALDPRWYGLNLTCRFTGLKNLLNLESLH